MSMIEYRLDRLPGEAVEAPPPAEERWRDIVAELARTAAWLAVSAALAAALWWVLGPPRLPLPLPSADQVRDVLTGSELPEAVVLEGSALIGWAVTGYLLLVLALRLVALAGLVVFGTGRALLGVLRLLDLVTLPPMRRLTEGALAGVVMTSAWLTPPAKARAMVVNSAAPALPLPPAPAPERELAPVWAASGEAVAFRLGAEAMPVALPARMAVSYTVAAGDTLWQVAQRFYGDGRRYGEIVQANTGREVAPGVRFEHPDQVRPGWELLVPLPAERVDVTPTGMTYVVRPGDSLWGIATRLLGSGTRWMEVWDLNQGRDMGGGRRFTDAGALLPGWTLRLPPVPVVPLADPPAAAAPAPTPSPAPPPVAAAPAATVTDRPVSVTPTAPAVPVLTLPAPAEETPGEAGDGTGTGGGALDARIAAVALAGVAAVGVGAVALRQARRTGGTVSPATTPSRAGGSTRRRGRVAPPRGDLARVALVGRLTLGVLADLGYTGPRLLTCRETADAVTLLVACPPGDAEAVAGPGSRSAGGWAAWRTRGRSTAGWSS